MPTVLGKALCLSGINMTTGGNDEIIPAHSSHSLGEVPGVDRKLYPNLRHEIHNEPEGPEVIADIADWLDAQL